MGYNIPPTILHNKKETIGFIRMDQIMFFTEKYLADIHVPSIQPTDIVEIIIISFLVYQIMVWIKNTKAWSLLKGVVFIMLFILMAAIFEMNTIIWIAKNVFSLAVIGVIIVLQPELRKAGRTGAGRQRFRLDLPDRRVSGFHGDRRPERARSQDRGNLQNRRFRHIAQDLF